MLKQVTEWPSDWVTKWPSDQVTEWPSDKKLRRQLTVWYIYYWLECGSPRVSARSWLYLWTRSSGSQHSLGSFQDHGTWRRIFDIWNFIMPVYLPTWHQWKWIWRWTRCSESRGRFVTAPGDRSALSSNWKLIWLIAHQTFPGGKLSLHSLEFNFSFTNYFPIDEVILVDGEWHLVLTRLVLHTTNG